MTEMAIKHNHMTRDIKPRGVCPKCDEYHARIPPDLMAALEKSLADARAERDQNDSDSALTSNIEPRPSGSHRLPDNVTQELADLARLIDRADAEASRLRARRLVAWRAARDAGLSWRAIAAASGGMDHAGIAKTVNVKREGNDDV